MNNKFAGKGGSQLPQPVDLTPYFDMANSIVKHNEELDQGKSKNIEMVRLMLKKKMAHSFLGQLYEWLLIIFSTASTMQYIFTTYYVFIEYETEELLQKANRDVLNPLNNLERFWSVMFLLDLLLYLFLADSKMMYISSSSMWIIILSSIPVWLSSPRRFDEDYSTSWYLIHCLAAFQILRCLRIHRKISEMTDDIKRVVGGMALTVIVIVMFNASIIQVLEYAENPFEFHIWVYFMCITSATVGYGDMSAITTKGRVAIMIMIAFSIVMVPQMTNNLISVVAESSVYVRNSYREKKFVQHVIVCGNLSSVALLEFFNELFHEDHSHGKQIQAVILTPFPPGSEMRLLLQDPVFISLVTYLQGSTLNDSDLERAKAESCIAIFLLTNKFTENADNEDSKAILQHLAISNYIKKCNEMKIARNFPPSPSPMFCVQMVRPQNIRLLHINPPPLKTNKSNAQKYALTKASVNKSFTICINEIKMGVMAKSVLYPGINTLIMNLLMSDDGESRFQRTDGTQKDASSVVEAISHTDEWMHEYQKGRGWEIYVSDLSPYFEGAMFSKLSFSLYDRLGIVLMGLTVKDKSDESRDLPKVFLNPVDFIVPSFAIYHIRCIVMADNVLDADLSYFMPANTGKPPKYVPMDEDGIRRSVVTLTDPASEANTSLLNRMTQSTMRIGFGGGSKLGGADHKSGKERTKIQKGLKFDKLDKSGEKITHIDDEYSNLERSESFSFSSRRITTTSRRQRKTTSSGQQPQAKKKKKLTKQEVSSEASAAYMKEHYYCCSRPTDPNEVTIGTSLLEEMPQMKDHILIIGVGMNNLYDLIRPLRVRDTGPLKYIVVLYPEDIPHAVWQEISIFEGILLLRGSAQEEQDLRRAGIFRAAHVVILADTLQYHSGSEGIDLAVAGLEALIDSNSIFAFKAVKRMNQRTHIIVEFVRDANIEYLKKNGNRDQIQDYRFSPLFASGSLFTSSLLDSMVCQAYFEPAIIEVIKQFTQSNHEACVVGDAHSSKGGKNVLNVQVSSLYQIDIPEEFVGKRYGGLYNHLAQEGVIPIGLYRGIVENINIGRLMNRMPYVYTNPSKNTEIYACDRVFVLATKDKQSELVQDFVNKQNSEDSQDNNESNSVMQLQQFKLKAWQRAEIESTHRILVLIQRMELLFSDSQFNTTATTANAVGKLRSLRQALVQLPQDNFYTSNRVFPQSLFSSNRVASQLDNDSRLFSFVVQYIVPSIQRLRDLLENEERDEMQIVCKQYASTCDDANYPRVCFAFNCLQTIIKVSSGEHLEEVPLSSTSSAISNLALGGNLQMRERPRGESRTKASFSLNLNPNAASMIDEAENEIALNNRLKESQRKKWLMRTSSVIGDFIDNIEISLWDCSVEKFSS